MRGFPQSSFNPDMARPLSFGCAFGVVPGNSGGVIACAYGIDPSKPRAPWGWPDKTGEALQMCDWRGGLIDADPLKDFVVFGSKAKTWIETSKGAVLDEPEQLAQAMAEACMDYLALQYGAPLGKYASMSWVVEADGVQSVLAQSMLAKRLILAQWEADQLSIELRESAKDPELASGPLRI